MTTVTAVVTQTVPYQTYVHGDCDCGKCSAFSTQYSTCDNNDWRYGTASCCFTCPKQPQCSAINPAVCPTLTGGTTSVAWTQADNNNAAGAQVSCNYNASNFTTSDVVAWSNAINAGTFDNTTDANAQYDSIIMPTFCQQQTNTCPTGSTVCSRFVSTGADGNACRVWIANGVAGNKGYNSANADTAMGDYCTANPSAAECICINRSANPTYQLIEAGGYGLDSCWWKPCSNNAGGTVLIPSSLIIQPGDCTASICENIENFVDGNGNINLNDVNNYVNCPITPKPGPSPPGPSPGPSPPGPSPSGSSWHKWLIWLIIGLGAFLLLLLVGAIIFAARR